MGKQLDPLAAVLQSVPSSGSSAAVVKNNPPPAKPAANQQPAGRDVDGVPYCRTHHVRMVQSSSPGDSVKSYYRCPVGDCNGRECRVKPSVLRVVPTSPTMCQRCSAICERDQRLSAGGKIVLRCPSCEWTAPPIADPGLVASMPRQLAERANSKKLGDRS